MMPPVRDRGGALIPGLVPHTGVARFLTEIVLDEPGFIEAIGVIPAVHPLVTPCGAPCFLGLELGAQAAAALETLTRRAEDGEHGARIGYLVRIREAEFLKPELPTDTPLGVTARLERGVRPLGIHRVCVSVGGVDFLRAVLGTYSEAR
jgi:predicted hotdog family 3-hydroxylacyl-ACP dehydratase